MSHGQVWRTHRQYAATAARWSAERWRREAERRRAMRADRKPLVRDARRALATARAIDPEGITSIRHRAERELRTAKRRVPDPLWLFAAKTSAALAVAGYVWLPQVPTRVWVWSAVALVAAVTALSVWIAVRERDTTGLKPTAEESALLKRLQPQHWKEHAEQRGLVGTLTGRPRLTEAGIVCAVRLDGTWTATKLRSAEDHVRALIGARTSLRMQIKAGKQGGWAELTLRTRSAADGDDLTWTPEQRSLGVDTVTGEQVMVPLGERLLIAGRSGAGKSVASRPLLYAASDGDANALVIIDLKRVEGRLWDHRARVASTPREVVDVVDELETEMLERLSILPKGQDTWTPTPDRPRITVVVDEGAEVMTAADKVPCETQTADGKTRTVNRSALPGLESLARMGRAACIDLWWMTQKPTIGDGIPKQIAPQIGVSICLAVRTPAEARVVLGEDAQAKGWNADELPVPGVALIRDGKRKPDPIKVRYMDKAVVIALPDRTPWSRTVAPAVQVAGAPTLTLVKNTATGGAPATDSAVARVLKAIETADEPVLQKDLATITGLSKGAVSKAVKTLTTSGTIARAVDGRLAATSGDDTAAA
ncbi:MarR family transcriptional regulator [Streptomyces turgidiscabies]|uniref:FtsK/SpoIIIE family protein n=1 Tax=Streptomyces turgidiscabies (strain Car8) TaxID=698760 RepID=L7FHV1_STRT8|nr:MULTISPECIES: MarR family transcriptional regulator [Streptomyces]ELP70912.1 FtsK/SpoIIIE family protein [Streptomyces turgidiscabies Car8]MDX3496911.1 MarR family transcriptional regulator [Streptomyces turgidiscabies]GAQ73984.1 DNA translocase FtsK [Streptomyces turgidiscabies]